MSIGPTDLDAGSIFPSFQPCQIDEVELSEPLPVLEARMGPTGAPYSRSRILVRVHGQPIGLVEVTLDPRAPAGRVAHAIDETLRPQLADHLVADHLAADRIDLLPMVRGDGITAGKPPACLGQPLDLEIAPLVSVVVPTHSRSDQLPLTLTSLLANNYPRFEIVVVDNNPSDPDVRELVEIYHRDDRRVRYVREWSQGLSRARNTGYLFTRGEIVAFTDDDVTVDRSWITSLVIPFVEDPEVTCVTGLVLAGRLDTEVQLRFEEAAAFNKGFRRRVFDLAEHRPASPLFPLTAAVMGTGADFAVRKSALGDLWQFDPALGAGTIAAGGEDMDFFAELMFDGHRLVYEPRALVWHTHVDDQAQMHSKMHSYGIGFSAYLTKQLVQGSGRRLQMLRVVPAGLAYALRPHSRHDPRRTTHSSRSVLLAELRGMARGPWAYFRSRLHNAWLTD